MDTHERIAELEAALAVRDERIAQLEQQVAELREQVAALTEQLRQTSSRRQGRRPHRG